MNRTVADVGGLLERLREDVEMLQDGYQTNLTERWHTVTMKEAAQDISEAIIFIQSKWSAGDDKEARE